MKRLAAAAGLSAEARKGIAVLGVAAFAVVVLAYLLLSWQAQEADRLRQAQSDYALVEARTAKAVSAGATRLTAADNVAPMFLDGATPGLAFAKFQSIAGDAAAAAGLEVKRIQPVDTGDGEAAAPYRVSMDIEGSIEQLRDFLVGVESQLPVMFVTGLEIQPAADAADGSQYPSEALRATVRIEAYGWRAAP